MESRQRRSIERFNDPMYPTQWYLVRQLILYNCFLKPNLTTVFSELQMTQCVFDYFVWLALKAFRNEKVEAKTWIISVQMII